MVAILQYGGSFASVETQTVNITIVDEMNHPKYAEIEIASPGGNRSTTYSPYDEIRVVDTDVTGTPVLFRGKVEKISTPTNPRYGQIVILTARDNLAELGHIIVNPERFSENGADALICQLVRTHIKTVGTSGIEVPAVGSNTSVFETSLDTNSKEHDGTLGNKTVLQAMQHQADVDAWHAAAASTENYGFHFYLDGDNSLHYHQTGAYPSAPASNGLGIVYGLAADTDGDRQMLPNPSWDEITEDIVSHVDCHYISNDGTQKVLRLKRITITNLDTSAGPFAANQTLTGRNEADDADTTNNIELVTSGALIISNPSTTDKSLSPNNYLQGAELSTTTPTTADYVTTPDQELNREKVLILSGLPEFLFGNSGTSDVSERGYVTAVAAYYLRRGFIDISANTHAKGTVKIAGYPWHRYASTTTVVRAGNQVYLQDSLYNSTQTTAANYTVSRIVFNQSINGEYTSTLYVTNNEGQAWKPTRVSIAKASGDEAEEKALNSDGRDQNTINTKATSSGGIPATYNNMGIFQYDNNAANFGSLPSLAFLSGQRNATVSTTNHSSSFWSMWSKPETSNVSYLYFDPIISYNYDSPEYYNYAYIGANQWIYYIRASLLSSGSGSASYPSHSFSGGSGYSDAGMYLPSINKLGFATDGYLRTSITSAGTKLDMLASGTGTDIIHDGNVLKAKSSSRRYKENIIDLSMNTENIYDLRPVSFDWKGNGKSDFGLIAEEVDDVLPTLVHYQNDVPESVAYDKLSVLLLIEVKKLREEIKDLKEKK
jgi:hypothetical protein